MTEPTPPAGMDLFPYLQRWHAREPHRCMHDTGDYWIFQFAPAHPTPQTTLRCDVVSFHGVGIVEDLIAACVAERAGWTHELSFDRDTETFSAVVSTHQSAPCRGETSLNPGISLLSAYLNAIDG